jgi:flagellar hook-length control protein FliK
MISPDLAASPPPGPVQPRDAVRRAEAPPPGRAFEAFVEEGAEAPAEAAPGAEALLPDLLAMPDLVPPILAPAVAAVAAISPEPGDEPADEGDAPAPVATTPEAARRSAPAPVVQGSTPAPVAPTPVAEAPAPEFEAEAEPEAASARGPSGAAPPAGPPSAADLRPIAAMAAAQAGFDLAAQPAATPSWRLSAVAAEAVQAAPEPPRFVPPSPRDVASQITVAIAQSSQPQIEVRLDPPELGRVQIRLNPTEHGMQALVTAERPETQDFLRRHADVLVRDLTDAGYASVSLDFANGGEAAPRDAPDEERRLTPVFAAPASQTLAREAAPRPVAAGLDIRL